MVETLHDQRREADDKDINNELKKASRALAELPSLEDAAAYKKYLDTFHNSFLQKDVDPRVVSFFLSGLNVALLKETQDGEPVIEQKEVFEDVVWPCFEAVYETEMLAEIMQGPDPRGAKEFLLTVAGSHNGREKIEQVIPKNQVRELLTDLFSFAAEAYQGALPEPIDWYDEYGQIRDSTPQELGSLCMYEAFPFAVIDHAAEQRRHETPLEHMERLRHLERKMLEKVMGIPKTVSDDFRYALRRQTVRQNTQRDESVNAQRWYERMVGYCEKVQDAEIGVSGVEVLRKKFGFVDISKYPQEQLTRMLRLYERDPELLESLQNGDVIVSLTDAFGERGQAFGSIDRINEAYGSLVLQYEIDDPAELYGHIVRLSRLNIKPSTLIFTGHGSAGQLFVNSKSERIAVSARPDTEKEGSTVNLSESGGFDRFVEEYMQPHSETGERQIILIACRQAEEYIAGGYTSSTAEDILHLVSPENQLVVDAAAGPINIQVAGPGALQFVNHKERRVEPTLRFSHDEEGDVVWEERDDTKR